MRLLRCMSPKVARPGRADRLPGGSAFLRWTCRAEQESVTAHFDPDSTFGPMPSRKHQSYTV